MQSSQRCQSQEATCGRLRTKIGSTWTSHTWPRTVICYKLCLRCLESASSIASSRSLASPPSNMLSDQTLSMAWTSLRRLSKTSKPLVRLKRSHSISPNSFQQSFTRKSNVWPLTSAHSSISDSTSHSSKRSLAVSTKTAYASMLPLSCKTAKTYACLIWTVSHSLPIH